VLVINRKPGGMTHPKRNCPRRLHGLSAHQRASDKL
jgi:hypothetical protein